MTDFEKSVLEKLLNGEWVDTRAVLFTFKKYLNISFLDGLELFDFRRTIEWNQPPLERQKVMTEFKLKNEDLVLYQNLTVEEFHKQLMKKIGGSEYD